MALSLPASPRAAELWVGADDACDTPSLADAIATARSSPGNDVIRLARNQPYENQSVQIDTSVELIGGYPNCGTSERSGHTPIAGTGARAVIAVDGGSGAEGIDVRLDRLDVSGGGGGRNVAYRGGISIRGAARVRLSDSVIHHNDATLDSGHSDPLGSGLSIDGARASAVLERGIHIHDNKAPAGGGIGVRSGSLRILPHDISIERNQAGSGGGIAVLGDFIRGNGTAAIATDGGDPALPVTGVRIVGNVAAGGGGGLLVSQAELSADDVIVEGNHAQVLGSAILVGYEAVARLARRSAPDARHCPPELDCLRLAGNGPNNSIRVDNGGQLLLDGVRVRENISGTYPISVGGDESALRVSGSLIANDSPSCYYSLVMMSGGTFEFEHSTIARTHPDCWARPLIISYASAGLGGTNVSGRASLVSGFIKILQPPETSPLYSEHYDCVMKDRGDPEPAAVRSGVGPIQFVDAAGGNFRLAAGNAAIDYCDGGAPSSQQADLDGKPRGIDDPNHPDRYGPYDLGAYEFGSAPDQLFADGFEARP